jgi:F420-non-reducing hydrogenase large subunit
MRRITIDPVTRLEGHGRVEIFLDDDGEVANAYFIVPELRGFERLCVGRPAEEMPRITNRICGVCPEAHHIASVKTLDELFCVEPPPAARMIRELFYSAFFVLDHATHFFVLGGPDFIVGPDAPPAERTIAGVIRRMDDDLGRAVIDARLRNNRVIELLGGRSIHPVAGLPGGWSQAVSEEARQEIVAIARANVDFAVACLGFFEQTVLGNPEYMDMILSESYTNRSYYLGTVDEAGRPNFYDGRIRVVDPDGGEVASFAAQRYQDHISEHTEPWTYLKMPFLKNVGWAGLREGEDSGIYVASPLSRLNVASGLATPLAQEHFEKLYESLGSRRAGERYVPVHYRLATHWARLVELLYAAERMLELAADRDLTDPDVHAQGCGMAGEAVGCVEAPRGTLFHHYWADPQGIVTGVNLIVGTTNNHAAIAMSITQAARGLITKGKAVGEGLLNRIEMALRAYDPCLSCATHALAGKMPLAVSIRDKEGELIERVTRG